MQESVNSDAPLTRFEKKVSRYHTGSNLLLDYDCFVNMYFLFYPMFRQPLGGLGLIIFRGFAITHFRHTALGRTPLDE